MPAIHYILLIAGALATGLPATALAFPLNARPYMLGASAVCALIATICGAISGPITTASGRAAIRALPPTAPPIAADKPPSAEVTDKDILVTDVTDTEIK
jgi:hypothetical protein